MSYDTTGSCIRPLPPPQHRWKKQVLRIRLLLFGVLSSSVIFALSPSIFIALRSLPHKKNSIIYSCFSILIKVTKLLKKLGCVSETVKSKWELHESEVHVKSSNNCRCTGFSSHCNGCNCWRCVMVNISQQKVYSDVGGCEESPLPFFISNSASV